MNQDEFFDRADEISRGENPLKRRKATPGRPVTEEQAEEERRQRLEGKITPELLTHFDRKEALELVAYFGGVPTAGTQEAVGTSYDLYKLNQGARQFLAREIQGKRIIEIGDAGRSVNRPFFMELGARSFETADPNFSGIDGLTYLMRQPDGSAVVTSFGVLDDGVLYGPSGCEISTSLGKYVGKLCNQIYRVTPKGGITLHGLEWDGDLLGAGFVNDANAPRQANSYTPGSGGLRLLRKE